MTKTKNVRAIKDDQEDDERRKVIKQNPLIRDFMLWVPLFCFAIFCCHNIFIHITDDSIGIDSYVISCELSDPYTCLDASFDDGYVEFATYGRHDDIVVEGCAHMTMREHDNAKHIIDIYGFRCARGDNLRDIYIDGNKEGHIEFSEMTGW